MIVNFNEDETIIILGNGIELRISEDEAWKLANKIYENYADLSDDV